MLKRLAITIAGCALLLTACGGNGENGGKGSGNAQTPIPSSVGAPSPSGANGTGAVERLKPEQLAQALLEGQYGRVHAQMSEQFRSNVTEEQLQTVYEEIKGSAPEWKSAANMQLNEGRYLVWTNPDERLGLLATFDSEDTITGLQIMPLDSYPDTDKQFTKLAYGLPFEGEWYVFWGGRNVLVNYHYEYAGQRYAYDFIRIQDGFSYSGDPTKNESYYAFGQPILAPEEGKVVHVVNDIADNVPVGKMNEEHPAGNVVVIDHGNGEFSFLAHLLMGSVKVKVGDRVAKGDTVGLCGNSGNSSEPHLHYQVSDKQDLFEGKSIRIRWDNELDPLQGTLLGEK